MTENRVRRARRFGVALCIAGALLVGAVTEAAAVNIVAIGASNTRGKRAGGPAWPEYLQEMLRAKGYEAAVSNAGIDGDTTAGMLSRLDSAVPDGTQLVILQPSRRNGLARGITNQENSANIAAMMSRLRARHIKVILFERLGRRIPSSYIVRDGKHISTEGHRLLAAQLLPQVTAALGRRK